MLILDKEFEETLYKFLESFEVVFDEDWGHTRDCLSPENIDGHIGGPAGTLLTPAVADVRSIGTNWSNHRALLESYARLIELLLERQARIN